MFTRKVWVSYEEPSPQLQRYSSAQVEDRLKEIEVKHWQKAKIQVRNIPQNI